MVYASAKLESRSQQVYHHVRGAHAYPLTHRPFTQNSGYAHQAYNSAMLRLNQTSLEGQSTLSSVSMLDVAKIPDKPDSPKIFLNLVLSLILGSLLGLGFGLLVEMIDRRIRCAEDLIDSLHVPVLGIIKQGISNQQNKKRLPLIWSRLLRKQ